MMITIGILKMFRGIPFAALCLLAVALSTVSVSALQLHGVFTDHMVLQREIAMPVWGWAEPGERLTVEFGGQRLETTADREGKWLVKLAPMKANSSPQELIVSGKNTLRLTDVLVGDVWLCSGQSNMELRMGDCRSQQDIDLADFPGIRAITLPLICAERPQANIRDEGRRWVVCSRGSAPGISGVGFYFARRIHRQTGVPIGLLVSSVGGTNIEKWMPREAFDGEPALADITRTLDRAVAEYRQDVSNSLAGVEAWLPIARASLAENKPLPDAPEVFKHPFMPRLAAGGGPGCTCITG